MRCISTVAAALIYCGGSNRTTGVREEQALLAEYFTLLYKKDYIDLGLYARDSCRRAVKEVSELEGLVRGEQR